MATAAEYKSLDDHTHWLALALKSGVIVFALTPVAGALWILVALGRDDAAGVADVVAAVRSEVASGAFVMPAVAVAFVVWLWRAYGNLPALGAAPLPYARWWVVGAWLVPVLNVIRPWQIVVALWDRSDPNALTDAGGARAVAGRSALVDAWWGLWLLGATLASLSFALGARSGVAGAVLVVLAQLAWGTGAAALVPVVYGVHARQVERARRLGIEPDAGGAGPDVVARARARPHP